MVEAEEEWGRDEMGQVEDREGEAGRTGGFVGGGAEDGIPYFVMRERRIRKQVKTGDPLWIGRDVGGRGHEEFMVECGSLFIAGDS